MKERHTDIFAGEIYQGNQRRRRGDTQLQVCQSFFSHGLIKWADKTNPKMCTMYMVQGRGNSDERGAEKEPQRKLQLPLSLHCLSKVAKVNMMKTNFPTI